MQEKLYLDEIQSVLDVKNQSLTKVNSLIDKENELVNKLKIIEVCPMPPADAIKIAYVKNVVIAGSENSLNYLNVLKDSIDSNINDMDSVKAAIQNSEYPTNPTDADNTGEAEQYASLNLLTGYQDLKDKKILDIDAANKEADSIAKEGDLRLLNATKAHADYDTLSNDCSAAILAPANP